MLISGGAHPKRERKFTGVLGSRFAGPMSGGGVLVSEKSAISTEHF